MNGEALTRWLLRGAQRLTGELPEEPLSLWNGAVAGRNATARSFEVNIASAQRLWLLVTDTGSNAPERVLPMWCERRVRGGRRHGDAAAGADAG